MPERTSSNCSAGSWWWSPCSSSTVPGPTLTGPGRAVLRRRDAHRHRCPVGGSRLTRGRSYGSGPGGPSVRRPGCSGRPAWPPPSRSRRVPRRCRRARRSPPGADSCPDTAGPPGPAQHTDGPGQRSPVMFQTRCPGPPWRRGPHRRRTRAGGGAGVERRRRLPRPARRSPSLPAGTALRPPLPPVRAPAPYAAPPRAAKHRRNGSSRSVRRLRWQNFGDQCSRLPPPD